MSFVVFLSIQEKIIYSKFTYVEKKIICLFRKEGVIGKVKRWQVAAIFGTGLPAEEEEKSLYVVLNFVYFLLLNKIKL